jgi:protein-tyrosine phosphatase
MMACVDFPPPRPRSPYRVCLVCTGNICRSPMAETVLRHHLTTAGLTRKITVDSAGTGDWHAGEPMHPAARAALTSRGYDGAQHRSRRFDPAWSPDLILAMDMQNLASLAEMGAARDRMRLFGAAGDLPWDAAVIPDPYGGGGADFSRVLSLIEQATPVITTKLARLAGR